MGHSTYIIDKETGETRWIYHAWCSRNAGEFSNTFDLVMYRKGFRKTYSLDRYTFINERND